MKKISFIFPIYKESPYLLENISKILSDPYPSELKEIIVVVDCPTEEFLEKLKEIRHLKNLKLLISSERRGKVAATNLAASYASGDILIFIDSDARIVNMDLKKVLDELENSDVLEFYKSIIPKGFWNKLYHLEFLIYMEIISPLLSKEGSILLNGAGFAVKRKVWRDLGGYSRVIVEDVDFAIRAYEKGYIVRLSKSIILEIAPLESFWKWIDQRKRWMSGGVEVFILHVRTYVEYFLRKLDRLAYLLLLLLLNPAILFFLLSLVIPYFFAYSLAKAIYVSMVENISILYIFVLSPYTIYSILISLYYFVLLVLSSALVIYVVLLIKNRKILNPLYVVAYVGAYSIIQSLIILYVLIYYIIFEGFPKFNWKI